VSVALRPDEQPEDLGFSMSRTHQRAVGVEC